MTYDNTDADSDGVIEADIDNDLVNTDEVSGIYTVKNPTGASKINDLVSASGDAQNGDLVIVTGDWSHSSPVTIDKEIQLIVSGIVTSNSDLFHIGHNSNLENVDITVNEVNGQDRTNGYVMAHIRDCNLSRFCFEQSKNYDKHFYFDYTGSQNTGPSGWRAIGGDTTQSTVAVDMEGEAGTIEGVEFYGLAHFGTTKTVDLHGTDGVRHCKWVGGTLHGGTVSRNTHEIHERGGSRDNDFDVNFISQIDVGASAVDLATINGEPRTDVDAQNNGFSPEFNNTVGYQVVEDGRWSRGRQPIESSLVEAFERTNVSHYGGQPSQYQTQTGTVLVGDKALQGTRSGQDVGISTQAMPVRRGERIRLWTQFDTAAMFLQYGFLTQSETANPDRYQIVLNDNGGEFKLSSIGVGSLSQSASQSYSTGTWYAIELYTKHDGTVEASLLDTSLTELNSLSGTDSNLTEGGIGFRMATTDGNMFADYVTRQRP